MTLDDIPADVLMTLTGELERLFLFARCSPTCHVCGCKISVGDSFQLLSYHGRDEMVCSNCGRDDLEHQHQEKLASGYKWIEHRSGHGWYHKVVSGYSRVSR